MRVILQQNYATERPNNFNAPPVRRVAGFLAIQPERPVRRDMRIERLTRRPVRRLPSTPCRRGR